MAAIFTFLLSSIGGLANRGRPSMTIAREPHREVWYHCVMHGSVNRFLAYLLLLLLPSQSLAAVAVSPCYVEMTHAIMVKHAIEDCHGTSFVQLTKSDARAPDTKPHPENPPASHVS